MPNHIYLIQPTYRDANGHLLQGKKVLYHSLALPALSSTIPPDWEKTFCLEYFENVDFESDAQVIGISSMGYDITRGYEIAGEFLRRGKQVLFGGPQAPFSISRLQKLGCSVVHGYPGANEMSAILNDAAENRLAPEYEGGKHLNFPFDYTLLKQHPSNFISVLLNVGCKQNCAFCCTAGLFQGSYNLRRLDNVITDLHSACSISRRIVFVDANIYNNRDYLLQLCSRILEEKLKFIWGAQATIDIGDDTEVLNALKRTGCRLLFLGIESIEQENLNQFTKQISAGQHRERIKRIKQAGMTVGGYFILGLDNDTPTTFEDTYRFIHETRISIPLLNLLLPAPGTRTFEQLKQESRLLIQEEEDYLMNNPVYNTSCNRCFYVPKQLSIEETEERFFKLYRQLCTWREIVWRSASLNPTVAATLLILNLDMRREALAMAKARKSLPQK